jgi:hypothetical protein
MEGLPTTFYADTWHDTREGALKCPVCKPKVLAAESKLPKAPVQPPHLVTDVWGQNGYTTDADGIRSRAVKHVLNGVVPPGYELKWHATSNTKQRLELWESYLRGVGSLFS